MGHKSTFWSVLKRTLSKQPPSTNIVNTTANIKVHDYVDFPVVQHWMIKGLVVKDMHEIFYADSKHTDHINAVVTRYADVADRFLISMGLDKSTTTVVGEGSSEKSRRRGAAKRAEKLNDAIISAIKHRKGWKGQLVKAMGRPPLWFTMRVFKVLEQKGWKCVAAEENSQADHVILYEMAMSAQSKSNTHIRVHSIDSDFLVYSHVNFTLVKRDRPYAEPQLIERDRVLKLLGTLLCFAYYQSNNVTIQD